VYSDFTVRQEGKFWIIRLDAVNNVKLFIDQTTERKVSMTIPRARNSARLILLAALTLLAWLFAAVLLQGPPTNAQQTASPSVDSSTKGPSLELLLAAAHMREAHILAAEANPEATRSIGQPQTATSDNTPNPIPAGFFFPGPGMEASTITDFTGLTGVAAISGTGTETESGVATVRQEYDTDVRFMKGLYVGADGALHNGTFVFL
jgi:hypothetical protein